MDVQNLPLTLDGLPSADGAPVFAAPWQAQAFAMVLALHQAGAFTWTEWAATLAQKITAAQQANDPDLGDTYYDHWLAALEDLVARKGLGTEDDLAQYQHAWQHAAARTPHGQAIHLTDDDFEP
jgi:nitrile hydratase accessory protein